MTNVKEVDMKSTKLFLLAASGLSIIGSAYAGSVSTTMGVSTNVISACSVSTVDVVFPDYDTIFEVTGTGSVDVTCTAGAGYEMTIDAGQNYVPDKRRMASAGQTDFLDYQLYFTSDFVTQWGDSDKAGTTIWPGVGDGGSGALQSHTVYGKIFDSQSVPVGPYSDTVTVIVYY